MQLSAARAFLSETDKAYSPVVQAEKLAQQAGTELTTLINALRPPGLESRTLPVAIQEYVKEWVRQSRIETTVQVDSTISLDPQMEQALFRVLQEALANVARHSRADRAGVAFRKENDHIELVIEDNGMGYDVERIVKGVGLASMRERVEAVNGTLDVSSRSPQGTCVTARVRRS
jgi:NarL family two-component system sensor histidine kinase LiaS